MHQKEIKPTKHTRLIATLGSYALRPTWQVSALAANPDGKSFWALCGGRVMQWDIATGEELSHVTTDSSIKIPSLKTKASYNHEWPFLDREGLLIAKDNILTAYLKKIKEPPTPRKTSTTLPKKNPNELWSHSFDDGSSIEGCDFLPNDRVIVSYGGFQEKNFFSRLACLSRKNGAEQWTFALEKENLASIYKDKDGVSYGNGSLGVPVCSADGKVIAVTHYSRVEDQRRVRVLLFRASGERFGEMDVNISSNGDNALLLAPDGSWLVCCENNNYSFRIFDLPSCKERFLGDGHLAKIVGLGWLGDSKRLLSAASDDPQVRLWDVERGEPISLLEPEPTHPLTIRALPDGFAAFYEHGAEAFDLLGNKRGMSSTRDLNSKKSIEISNDGEWAYWSGCADKHNLNGFVFGWNLSEAAPRWSFALPKYHSVALSLSKDALWVFEDMRALQLDSKTGAVLSKTFLPYQYTYKDATLLKDGETAVGIISWYDREMYDGKDYLRKWNCLSDKIEWSREENELMSSELCVSRSERWCVRKGYDSVIFHDLKDGSRLDEILLESVQDSPSFIMLSPDDTRLAVGTQRGIIFVFSLEGLPT